MLRVLAMLAWIVTAAAAPAFATVVLNRGNDGDPETLDAAKTSTVAEANLLRDLYEGLVIHDQKADVAPGVATSWTISPDGRTYTFQLRPDARWSNADPVVAQDFVFSLRRLLDPATGSKYAPVMFPILNAEKVHKSENGAKPEDLGVRATDPHTLEIRLERPTAYFLELLTNQTALPVHAASIARLGADWLKPGNLVSNGAFTLKSFVPNGSIVLTRNPRYHAAATVRIDEVRYFPTSDAAAATRRYLAGELHIINDVPTDQYAQLKARLGAQVQTAAYLGTSFLILNTRKAPFTDVRVRRALALAIDREFLADEIWAGTMLPAWGMVPPGVKNYPRRAELDSQQTPIEREDEARALLSAAGFSTARPLKVELRYNMTDNNQRTMVAIANQWKQVGVQTSFVHTDGKTHFAHLRDGGDFDAARYGWIADYSDAQNFLFLLESGNAGLNVGSYDNPAFDALMRRAAAEADLGLRADLLHAADRIFVADLPWIPLMFYQSKNLVSPRVDGFVPNHQAAHATRFMSLRP